MPAENALLIFTKNPVKGKVKTRLAKDIGEVMALKTYMQLLKHTREITVEADFCDCRILYNEFIPSKDNWPEDVYEKFLQGDGDLATKMNRAINSAFNDGYKKVAIISPDCPELTTVRIKQAYTLLNSTDFVLGPLKDGGYYLLAMKKPEPSLFDDLEFGNDQVYAKTINRIEGLGKSYRELPLTFDVDFAEDLTDKLKKLIGLEETTDKEVEIEEVDLSDDEELEDTNSDDVDLEDENDD